MRRWWQVVSLEETAQVTGIRSLKKNDETKADWLEGGSWTNEAVEQRRVGGD